MTEKVIITIGGGFRVTEETEFAVRKYHGSYFPIPLPKGIWSPYIKKYTDDHGKVFNHIGICRTDYIISNLSDSVNHIYPDDVFENTLMEINPDGVDVNLYIYLADIPNSSIKEVWDRSSMAIHSSDQSYSPTCVILNFDKLLKDFGNNENNNLQPIAIKCSLLREVRDYRANTSPVLYRPVNMGVVNV